MTYAVAAGNNSDSACSYSPSRAPAALTVAASTSTDARAYFSSYGSCVDLYAPGYSITMRPASLERYAFPDGPAWSAAGDGPIREAGQSLSGARA